MSQAAPTPEQSFYIPGGAMKPEAQSYVYRKADNDLFNNIIAGEFCYVLTARQMGKSSLMTRTAAKLAEIGVRSAQVDLTLVGGDKRSMVASQWYYGIAHRISRELNIPGRLDTWWREHGLLSDAQKFTEFLQAVVLQSCSTKIVIFVDEIDWTIGLPFSDDFFAAIRACYNARARSSALDRLSFVLLGVATPAELIGDPTRTPFNIGRGIQLADFTPEEALPLAAGLSSELERAKSMLQRVLYWTSGHPYLTQNLCWHKVRNATLEIDELVQRLYLSRQGPLQDDSNLQSVRDRLTRGDDALRVLQLYLQIAAGDSVREDPASTVQGALKLSGLVNKNEAGQLKIRNRIYKRVFSESWVRSEITVQPEVRPLLPDDIAEAYTVYDALRRSAKYRPEAIRNLALFWEGRGARDEAILTRLLELKHGETPAARKWIASLIEPDYKDLLSSYVHITPILAATLSPDGATVLTGSSDHTARLWSSVSGEKRFTLQHQGDVTAVAFSPAGDLVATGSDDRFACVWSAATGTRVGPPLTHAARVRTVTFNAKGNKLLTTSADGSAVLWNIPSGEIACPPLQHEFSVYLAALSPNGSIVTGGESPNAYLWDDSSGTLLAVLSHDERITAVASDASGDLVVSASEDGSVRLWDARSGRPLAARLEHDSAVQALAISHDCKLILTGTFDDGAYLWRLASGWSVAATVWHEAPVCAVTISPDGCRMVTGDNEGVLVLSNISAFALPTVACRHRSSLRSVAFSSDGSKVLTCTNDGIARLWNPQLPQSSLERESLPVFPLGDVTSVTFSEHPDRILICRTSGEVAVLPALNTQQAPLILHHPRQVLAGALNQRIAATGDADGMVRLWDIESGCLLQSAAAHAAPVVSLAFNREGTCLATGSSDGSAQLLDPETAQQIGTRLAHRGPVRLLTFAPDGSRLLTSGQDRIVRLWSSVTGQPLGRLTQLHSVTSAAWSPDGECFVLATQDGTVGLWRLDTGDFEDSRVVHSIQCHDTVNGIAFSPDGHQFAVTTRDWLYVYDITFPEPVLSVARFLPGRRPRALRWSIENGCVDVALFDRNSSLFVATLNLITPEPSPVEGNADELASDWSRRLGLFVDADARFSPAYS